MELPTDLLADTRRALATGLLSWQMRLNSTYKPCRVSFVSRALTRRVMVNRCAIWVQKSQKSG
jgi:hypothetical protein